MFKQPSIPTRSRTVGVPIILMARKTPSRLMTQSPVEALKIEAELLLVEFNRAGQLQEGLLRLRNTSPICWATETKSAPTGELQKRGLIRHDYGHVKILDRKRLETASCECYRIVSEWVNELRCLHLSTRCLSDLSAMFEVTR